MKSPTQTIHALYGCPAVSKPEPTGPIDAPHGCRVCGAPCDRGMPYADWGGSDTTTPGRVRSWQSAVVCEACVAICARFSPCPARPAADGKEPIRWSNLSILFDDEGLVTATKGEKDRIRAWLAKPKRGRWFAGIAESGQKHVIPWTPWNGAGAQRGTIRFEERDVVCTADALLSLVCDMTAFLTAGATKETIETGQYSPNQWRSLEAHIERFEGQWSHERGGDVFALALWLAQRDEAETAERIERENAERAAKKAAEKEKAKRGRKPNPKPQAGGDVAPAEPTAARGSDGSQGGARREKRRRAEGPVGGTAPRAARGVPVQRGERDHALGSPEDAAAGGCADVLVAGRVVHADPPKAPARSAEQGQLSLFGRADQ